MTKKRYLNDSEFSGFSEKALIQEIRRCEVMEKIAGTSVSRKGFAKRRLAVEKELQRRRLSDGKQ